MDTVLNSSLTKSSTRPDQVSSQLVRFVAVGLLVWATSAAMFLALRTALPALPANLVAALAGSALSTEINARFTFGAATVVHRARARVQDVAAAVMSAASGIAVLAVLEALAPGAGLPAETAALAGAGAVTGLLRFTVLRRWVFVDGSNRDLAASLQPPPGAPDPAATRRTISAYDGGGVLTTGVGRGRVTTRSD